MPAQGTTNLASGRRGPKGREPQSGHLALSVLDLIPKIFHVRGADYDWRAGKRSPRVQQARHATPDTPAGKLSRVGPLPIRDLALRRWAVLHCVLPANQRAARSRV